MTPNQRTKVSKNPRERGKGGDPFGDLGRASWGVPMIAAIFTFSALYGLCKFGGGLLPFPFNVIVLLLAVVIAATTSETVYNSMTGGLRTYGFQRWVLCFSGAFVPQVIVLFAAVLLLSGHEGVMDGAFSALLAACGWAVFSSFFGVFWLNVLDRMKGSTL